MDELTQKMEEARRHVHAEWDDDHAALVLVGMRRRAQRRKVARAGAGIAAVVIAAFVAVRFSAVEEASLREERIIELADGSTVTPLTIDSKIILKGVAPERIDVDFAAGSSRFEVLPNPRRTFVIDSGDVRIVVLG